MAKRRFMVVSGFLGSGKTTTMLSIADHLAKSKIRAAVISNDLGASELVDAMYTAENTALSGAIADGCICYQTELLVDNIKRFSDVDGAGLVMSDIPGCGVGALEHVYFKLHRQYPEDFELAPFTVICDPLRLRAIMPEHANLHLPQEINYLFRTQLLEADVIVLNKTDTISQTQQKKCLSFLNAEYPGIQVFCISAKTGGGVPELCDYLMSHDARLREVDTGYGGEEFTAAEAQLSWYDRRVFISRETEFDGNGFMSDFASSVAKKLKFGGKNVLHLKLFAAAGGDGDYAKASLIHVDYRLEFDRQLSKRCRSMRLVVNARAACGSMLLGSVMDEAFSETVEEYGVKCQVFSTESFGMTDEDDR